jgi:hypothetical protein
MALPHTPNNGICVQCHLATAYLPDRHCLPCASKLFEEKEKEKQ